MSLLLVAASRSAPEAPEPATPVALQAVQPDLPSTGCRALVIESRLCIAGHALRVTRAGAVLKMPFPLVPESRCTVRLELPSGAFESPARVVRELAHRVYAVEFDRPVSRMSAVEAG